MRRRRQIRDRNHLSGALTLSSSAPVLGGRLKRIAPNPEKRKNKGKKKWKKKRKKKKKKKKKKQEEKKKKKEEEKKKKKKKKKEKKEKKRRTGGVPVRLQAIEVVVEAER